MKKFLLILFLSAQFMLSGQTIQDYKDFIKLNLESSPPYPNYIINVGFDNTLTKTDAQLVVNKKLSNEEYSRLFYFDSQLYWSSKKANLFMELVKVVDLMGIRKVSTTTKEGDVAIIVYVRENYTCVKYDPDDKTHYYPDKIALPLKTDYQTIEKLKKAIIKLAELNGANSVIDGDNLF